MPGSPLRYVVNEEAISAERTSTTGSRADVGPTRCIPAGCRSRCGNSTIIRRLADSVHRVWAEPGPGQLRVAGPGRHRRRGVLESLRRHRRSRPADRRPGPGTPASAGTCSPFVPMIRRGPRLLCIHLAASPARPPPPIRTDIPTRHREPACPVLDDSKGPEHALKGTEIVDLSERFGVVRGSVRPCFLSCVPARETAVGRVRPAYVCRAGPPSCCYDVAILVRQCRSRISKPTTLTRARATCDRHAAKQPAGYRRRIEPRSAPPVDRTAPLDQRRARAVGQKPVVLYVRTLPGRPPGGHATP